MGIFGWNYPPGAENDPNAPWNQDSAPLYICRICKKEIGEDEGVIETDDSFICDDCNEEE